MQIHSPLRFLAHAMGEVLPLAKAKIRPTMAIAKTDSSAETSNEKRLADVDSFKQEQQDLEVRFCETFKTEVEQKAEIARLLQGSLVPLHTELARSLAILKWGEDLN